MSTGSGDPGPGTARVTRRARTAVAVTAGGLLVLALVAVAVVRSTDDADSRVLGVTADRESTASTLPGEPAEEDDAGETPPPEPDPVSTTTSEVTPPTPPQPPGPPAERTEVVTVDDGAFFTHSEDPSQNVAGSATTVERNRETLSLAVSGFARDGHAVLDASVDNDTDVTARFPAGLRVRVSVSRDGVPWRTVELVDPSITELGPGQSTRLGGSEPLDGYGHYTLSAQVEYSRPA